MPRWFVVALILTTMAHFALAAVLPPAGDEMYYWCWGQQLQFSYYDHPPLMAYLIRISTDLFGDNLFALRLPACLCSLGVLVLLGYLVRPGKSFILALLTPLFAVGAVMITPDAPLLLCWTAYLVWLVSVHRRLTEEVGPSWTLWLLGGVLLGLGILSKYTMGLAVPAALLSLFLARNWRSWLGGFAVHLLIAFVVASPILIYNIQQDFVPLLFQWRHAVVGEPPTIRHLPEYIGAQCVLVGFLPFALAPWAVARFRSFLADPRLRVCACMYLVPFAFFLIKAARGRLQPNWPLVMYVGWAPLAYVWLGEARTAARRWLAATSFAAPIAATAAVVVHLIWPIGLLSPDHDRLGGNREKLFLAERVGEALRERGEAAPVFTPTYQWTALLRFQHLDARQIPGLTRKSHFTPEQAPGPDRYREVLVFAETPLPPPLTAGFGPPQLVEQFPFVVRGQRLTTYQVWRYVKSTEPVAGTVPHLPAGS
jgi:4-amino-4-deoxy-L-arabinose transferase-like glycosyltransferase